MLSQAQASMLKAFRAALPQGRVLAAVSGGADSMALLRLLAEHLPPGRLAVAHVNHRTRGRASDSDEAFVRREAGKLGLPFLCRRLRKIPSPSEAALRDERYAALSKMAKQAKTSRIALAHTADDQAETVLLRIVRGTGTAGLAGIPSERAMGLLRIVRPLLSIGREDLVEYLRRHSVPFRTDRSNRDLRYARNRIRLKVLPELRKLNPRAREAILRLSEQAGNPARHREAFRQGLSAVHVLALEGLLSRGRGEVRLPGGRLLKISRPAR